MPWAPGQILLEPPQNPYGPTFVVLAFLAILHPLLPKLAFVGCWLWSIKFLRDEGAGYDALPMRILVFSPFFWVHVVWYGHFDIVGATTSMAALFLVRQNRDYLAAANLAFAVLMKYTPLSLLPFLGLKFEGESIRVRWNLVGATLGLIALTYLGCYLVYGAVAFNPFYLASTRGPKIFSIYQYLVSDYFPWPIDLTGQSFKVLAVVGFAVFVVFVLKRWDLMTGCLLATLVVTILNKVGHLQLFTALMMLIAFWMHEQRFTKEKSPRLWSALWIFMIWVNVMCLMYPWTGGYWHPEFMSIIRFAGGLPTFVMGMWLGCEIVLYKNKSVGSVT
jgi:hypothetical protein